MHETCDSVAFYVINKLIFWYLCTRLILPKIIGAVSASIIFDKIHFWLISENKLIHYIKGDGITSFMDFMQECVM